MKSTHSLGCMFSARWGYALLLLPLAGVAWVCAALLRVWDIWFSNNLAALWTIGGLIPYVLCFLGILAAVRSRVLPLAIAATIAGVLLLLPTLLLSATFGEG